MKLEPPPSSSSASVSPSAHAAPSSSASSATGPRRRRWRASAAGLVVVALAAGGWYVQSSGKPAQAHAGAAKKGDKEQSKGADKPAVMELASADVAAIEARALVFNLPLSGSLMPLTQATVKSKASGQVQESSLREGMPVRSGQVLAQLDTAELKARLSQQQGALEEAQARLAMASKNEVNNLALLKQKYISQTAYDTTQNTVELARANVKSAAALVEMARIALADSTIRAPISGIVSKRHVQPGEKLSPDMPVYSIVDLTQMILEAQVPAADIARIKIGQEVLFQVDGFSQRHFKGKVARINPTTEAGSRAMLVYVTVDNADATLRGGMFAKGSITTDRSAVVPLVPLAALRGQPDAPLVYKVENGQVLAQPLTLGLRNDDEGYAEVKSGLASGAQVLLARLEGVKPGQRVKLPPAATPAAAAAAAIQPGAAGGNAVLAQKG